jgi:hypothetical protein
MRLDRLHEIPRATVVPSLRVRVRVKVESIPPYFATIAARDPTANFAKMCRRCVDTVHELMLNALAIVLFGCPCATIRIISCSRGLNTTSARGALGFRIRR